MLKNSSIKKAIDTVSGMFNRRKTAVTPEQFRALFDRFKKVLDSNNSALEVITDMGEKLGGDYLFDIVYVGKAYADLKREMECSLQQFGELTGNRYPRLPEVFKQIDSLVLNVLSEQPALPGPFVLFFDDISEGSIQAAGGKIAQLAEVKNHLGLEVPAGFVITTAAFEEFVELNRLESLLSRIKEGSFGESDLEELQELILHGTVPPGVSGEIVRAVERLRKNSGSSVIAVRSSAGEEDGDRSFAGQFRTVLGVPLRPESVERAYRKVIASLFSAKATAYQRQTGHPVGSMKMAVGCMAMVDAVSSGVIYTSTPDGDAQTMMISAAWGLGEAIVEAGANADLYRVAKDREPRVITNSIGRKESRIVLSAEDGTIEQPVPAELRDRACLSGEQIAVLAEQAMRIERYFGSPRDIEWAVDKQGRARILQARPLAVRTREQPAKPAQTLTPGGNAGHPELFRGGEMVQPGIGAGKVFLAGKPGDSLKMPKGSVLVAPHDSSLFVRSMPLVSAIITERGSQTSHMAALCRELGIPTIVNMPDAMQLLKHGQEVTVIASDEGVVLYSGIDRSLLAGAGQNGQQMEALYEFRKKRYILRYLSPLHLIDPLMDEFLPERCRSMHDILRFMHEKSVGELVEQARTGSAGYRRKTVVPLDLPVPAGMLVMDMGGGLLNQPLKGKAVLGDVASVPFKAILRGMLHPGAWREDPVPLNAGDFLSSMMRLPDIRSMTESTAGYNLAVISRDYVNMSIRFGYHFNMLDCYCSEKAKNNHIYFRFAGGATDLTKRSRRLDLISRILSSYGFTVKIKGDLLIARLAGFAREEMEHVLDRTGRLIAFARQLDAVLASERDVILFAERFLKDQYELASNSHSIPR